MIKKIQKVEIGAIVFYKRFISPILYYLLKGGCRFEPRCSDYSILAIKKHGPFKGLYLSIVRFIECNPLSKHPRLYPLE